MQSGLCAAFRGVTVHASPCKLIYSNFITNSRSAQHNKQEHEELSKVPVTDHLWNQPVGSMEPLMALMLFYSEHSYNIHPFTQALSAY